MSSLNYCSLSKTNIKLDDYLNPNEVNQNLLTLLEKIPPVLDDFKRYYVFYYRNPENTEYQQIFSNLQNNIDSFGTKLFELLNSIDVNTDKLNEKLNCLNSMILNEKKKNATLKSRFGVIENKTNASSELIYDYKNMYEEGYLRNWGLVISILIVGFLVKNTYSNINGDMNSNLKNVATSIKNVGSNLYNNVRTK